MEKNHKGQMAFAGAISVFVIFAISLVTTIITISIGADVVNEIQNTQDVNSTAENVSQAGLGGINKFGDFLPIISLVLVASAIIGIIFSSFAIRQFQ